MIQSLDEHLTEFTVCTNKEKLAYLNHRSTAIVSSFMDWVQTLEIITGLAAKKESIIQLYLSNKFKYEEEHARRIVLVSQQCPYPCVANMLNLMARSNILEAVFNLILWTK